MSFSQCPSSCTMAFGTMNIEHLELWQIPFWLLPGIWRGECLCLLCMCAHVVRFGKTWLECRISLFLFHRRGAIKLGRLEYKSDHTPAAPGWASHLYRHGLAWLGHQHGISCFARGEARLCSLSPISEMELRLALVVGRMMGWEGFI